MVVEARTSARVEVMLRVMVRERVTSRGTIEKHGPAVVDGGLFGWLVGCEEGKRVRVPALVVRCCICLESAELVAGRHCR